VREFPPPLEACRLAEARSNVESFGRFLESVSFVAGLGSLMNAEQNLNRLAAHGLAAAFSAYIKRSQPWVTMAAWPTSDCHLS